jgi:hypothetical protein
VRQQQRRARREEGCAVTGQLDEAVQASVDRIAISRALIELGWLTFTLQSKAPPRPQRAGRKPKAEDRWRQCRAARGTVQRANSGTISRISSRQYFGKYDTYPLRNHGA